MDAESARRSLRLRPFVARIILLVTATACAVPSQAGPDEAVIPAREQAQPPIPADAWMRASIARGVVQHTLTRERGPWAIHVLDVDRTACWMPAALKREPTAYGRATTSALLAQGTSPGDTVAAVNADFFLFRPPGVPTGAHVDEGRVLSGPGVRPVLAIDSSGRAQFTRLRTRGIAAARGDSAAITEWNHVPVTRLGAFDERWGVWTDSTSGTLQVVIGRDGRVLQVVRGAVRASIPRGGWVLAAKADSPAATRRWLGTLRAGDSVRVRPSLAPFHPRDAVGGFPMLVVDSARARVLDSAHVQNLGKVRHPRTAIGLGRDGRRLLLVVVDGRRPGHSVGMTLPELADLMLELGATQAMNLDGGGSSAMVVRRADGGVQLVNRPSDAEGERAVANALAIVKGCEEP